MKKYIFGILAIISFSCTKNDGDIGDLFGKWQLKSVTEGESVEKFDSLFMSFQSNVMDIRKLHPVTLFKQNYGVYEHTGDSLFFYLSEVDNAIDEYQHDLYKEFRFDGNKERVSVESLSRKKMILEKRRHDGDKETVRKWYFEKF